jgi:CHAT domain-containing protein
VPEVLLNEKLEKQLEKTFLVAPSDTELEFARQEGEWLIKYAKEAKIDMEVISSYEEIIHALHEGGFDLLHFITHRAHNDKNSLYSVLELEDGAEIRPDEIFGNFGNSNPIVVLNACQTGIQGFSFTKIVGWSEKFIGSGCSTFIGTLWYVSDATTVTFTEELYKLLGESTPVGEAVRRARIRCKKFGDPSWLAYQLYVHPNLHITI